MRKQRGYTFHELLACVLLEECLMFNGAGKVVDHQAENGKDLFFGVIRVMN